MRGAECRRFPCAIRKISSTHVITWYDTKQTRHGPGGYPDAAKQVECKRVQTQCVYLVSVSCKRPCAFCRYVFKSDMECLMSSCRGRFYLPNCVKFWQFSHRSWQHKVNLCTSWRIMWTCFPWNLAEHVLVPPTKVADGLLIGNRSKSLLHYVCCSAWQWNCMGLTVSM